MTQVVHTGGCKTNMYMVFVIVFLRYLVFGLGEVLTNSSNISYISNYSNIYNKSNKSSQLPSHDGFIKFKEEEISSPSLTNIENNSFIFKPHDGDMDDFHPQSMTVNNSLQFTNLSTYIENTPLSPHSNTEENSAGNSNQSANNCLSGGCLNSTKIGIEKSLLLPIIPAQIFQHAAVSTDNEICSDVGRNILSIGGSAVDATIAALLCLGTVNFQSSGLGGGGSMILYKKETNEVDTFDFCEEAPAGITNDTFKDSKSSSTTGGLAIGIPGEVRGFQAAWRSYGRLPWETLVQPSIELAYSGFPISNHLSLKMRYDRPFVFIDQGLRDLLTYKNGTLKEEGTIIRRPVFAKTLEIIKDNPEDFYEGDLAKLIVEDIKNRGGILTLADMKDYRVKRRKPISSKQRNTTVYTTYLDGGPILLHILNINKGYNFSAFDVDSVDKQILTYHRIIESFKFSYAYRPYLGDPDDPRHKEQINNAIRDLLNPDVAENHRQLINDSYTLNISAYGQIFEESNEQGTTHVSILAENGDAVSATSSINYPFGSKFLSKSTGMVFNNVMIDFIGNNQMLSTANAPGPKKRTLSAKCPTIVVGDDGNVKLVIGAAGGNRIPLAIALVTMRTLWFGLELGEAIVQSRPAHVFFPNYVQSEYTNPLPSEIVEGLMAKHHNVAVSNNYNVVQAIYRDEKGTIYAKSDPRKGGKSSGY